MTPLSYLDSFRVSSGMGGSDCFPSRLFAICVFAWEEDHMVKVFFAMLVSLLVSTPL